MFIVLLLWVRCVFYNTSRPVKLHYYSVGHRCFDHGIVHKIIQYNMDGEASFECLLLSLRIEEIKHAAVVGISSKIASTSWDMRSKRSTDAMTRWDLQARVSANGHLNFLLHYTMH